MSSVSIRVATLADRDALSFIANFCFQETWVNGFKMPYSESDIVEFTNKAYRLVDFCRTSHFSQPCNHRETAVGSIMQTLDS
jgi:hypothetical protein